jgi:hypothetical protein
MGYTNFTIGKVTQILESIKSEKGIISVLDFGAQNNYNQPNLPAPFMSEWYSAYEHPISYTSIDLSGENGSLQFDLARPMPAYLNTYDLLCDIGTGEHVGIDGHFEWEAFYQFWKNKHDLCRIGGIIFSENPETGSWPQHGFQWLSKKLYWELCSWSDYELLECDRVAAMGNTTDGWNVYAIMKKRGYNFPSLEQFKTFSLFTS